MTNLGRRQKGPEDREALVANNIMRTVDKPLYTVPLGSETSVTEGSEEGLTSNPRLTDNFPPGLHISICETGQHIGIWKPLPTCGGQWRFPMGSGSAWGGALAPWRPSMKEQYECVPCPTPSLRAPSAQRPIQLHVPEALCQSHLYLLRALPGTAPPPMSSSAGGGGAFKGQKLC